MGEQSENRNGNQIRIEYSHGKYNKPKQKFKIWKIQNLK